MYCLRQMLKLWEGLAKWQKLLQQQLVCCHNFCAQSYKCLSEYV